MSGFQFVHLETYSRKTDPKGRSVSYVLDEAERRPDACLHVEAPLPPELIEGIPLDQLRAIHDAQAEAARATDSKGKQKKVRVDQHTLATVIASHPGGTPEQVAKWESLTVSWLRKTYGERLVSVVRHTDEGHPHLHAYLLPNDLAMRARAMHPGVEAKAAVKAEAALAGDDAKTSNAKGDRAYKAAMRSWQDDYWHDVGLPSGLARIGPGGRRLTRPEWHAEKAQVERVASLQPVLDQVDQAYASLAAAHAERDAAIKAAEDAKTSADLVVLTAEKKAGGIVSKAKREARSIITVARKEASRLRSIGVALGGFVQGILASSPSKVANLVRAEERALAAEQVLAVRVELKEARTELRQVKKTKGELVETMTRVATERDDAWAALNGNPNQSLAYRQGLKAQ